MGNDDRDLVLCRSDQGDGGWSLHAPGATDEQIAEGHAGVLACGEAKWDAATGDWNRPDDLDYHTARAQLRRGEAV